MNTEAGNLALIMNERGGSFADPRLFRVGPLPMAVAAGDIDRDDAIDLAVSHAEPPRVVVFSSRP